MNSPRRRRIWPYVLGLMAGVCLLPLVIVASHLGLGNDATILRDGMKAAVGGDVSTRIQFRSGLMMIPVARMVVSICNVKDEARIALSAVKSASVGVYELEDPVSKGTDFASAFSGIDTDMKRRGWERMVAVSDGNAQVLIYTRTKDRDSKILRMALAVLDGREMVVVSAEVRPEHLMPMIEQHLPRATRRT